MLSVLYQYENLTEDLEEDVKTGEKKRRPGGENKVGSNILRTETFWNWHWHIFQLKSSNGNTYVELKCSDVEEDEEEEGVEFLNNNKWENYHTFVRGQLNWSANRGRGSQKFPIYYVAMFKKEC